MRSFVLFILPFLNNIRKRNMTHMCKNACIEDEDMCVIDVVNNYKNNTKINPSTLKKYLPQEAIEDYQECILSSNDGCDCYWYIDDNFTQWRITNDSVSYLEKNPAKWIQAEI